MPELPAMRVLRALGALLDYPRREILEALPEIAAEIAASTLIGPGEKERLARLVAELRDTDPLLLEERYVELFDTGRSMSLCLFEHVHGDSRERGQAMVELKSLYERAGLKLDPHVLPDYLPVVLEYLSCREPDEVRGMLADCAHILRIIGTRLAARTSPYAAVFDALLTIAGERGIEMPKGMAAAEPARDIDEEWEEAPAFGPGSPEDRRGREPDVRPIHFMPRKRRTGGATG